MCAYRGSFFVGASFDSHHELHYCFASMFLIHCHLLCSSYASGTARAIRPRGELYLPHIAAARDHERLPLDLAADSVIDVAPLRDNDQKRGFETHQHLQRRRGR
jgi:hypothetical protein